MRTRSRLRRTGFTLIELMVAIAIIAVLAAIALPRFVSTRYRAYVSTCMFNERNLATALESYHTDMEAYPADLAKLVVTSYGGHINKVPTCPSSPGQAYVYEISSDYQNFTLICPGYHEHQVPGMVDGYPQYWAVGGLRENQ